MIVCICHRVSDRDIARAAREGCTTLEALQARLGVGSSCGKCRDCAQDTLHRHARAAGEESGRASEAAADAPVPKQAQAPGPGPGHAVTHPPAPVQAPLRAPLSICPTLGA